MILIQGGTVFTPEGMADADVWVDGESIAGVGVYKGPTPEHLVEAAGCLVGPGFVDAHVHFRDPGQTWKEDTETGSIAAAAGGYTAVVVMPNTTPAIDTPGMARLVLDRGREVGVVEVAVAAALTQGRLGLAPSDLEGLHREGVRIFSDDGDGVADAGVMTEISRRLARLEGTVLAQHSEMPGLGSGVAETAMVQRDLGIVHETGLRYHSQHVSLAATVDLIREARDAGLPVTSEVTPHHLVFTQDDALGNPNFKMYPPLRSEEDRLTLVGALRDGTIDMVATDHAPHTKAEKEVPFDEAPRGVIGVETAASIVWSTLEDPTRFFEVLSVAPARLAGLDRHGHQVKAGNPANLTVFDPRQTWTPTTFLSRSANSPFIDRELIGRVKMTLFEGRIRRAVEISA